MQFFPTTKEKSTHLPLDEGPEHFAEGRVFFGRVPQGRQRSKTSSSLLRRCFSAPRSSGDLPQQEAAPATPPRCWCAASTRYRRQHGRSSNKDRWDPRRRRQKLEKKEPWCQGRTTTNALMWEISVLSRLINKWVVVAGGKLPEA